MVEQKVDELGHWRPIRRFTIVIEAMEVELAWIAPVRCQMCKRWAHLHAPMGAIASTRTPQPATNTAGRTPMRIAGHMDALRNASVIHIYVCVFVL
jgi:hypothetical protein